MEGMNLQKFMVWYQEFISTDKYLLLNFIIIVLSFFTGEMSARNMMSNLSKKKYGDMIELLDEDKNNLYELWREAYTYFSKAVTYLCLVVVLSIQFVLIIFSANRDGITTTVLMFTIAVSVMEYRDNRSEFKRREKGLKSKQLNLMMQAEEIKDIEVQDKVLAELEKRGLIDNEKRVEIIKSIQHTKK